MREVQQDSEKQQLVAGPASALSSIDIGSGLRGGVSAAEKNASLNSAAIGQDGSITFGTNLKDSVMMASYGTVYDVNSGQYVQIDCQGNGSCYKY